MPERGWTPQAVAERLAEAADVLDRLPERRARGLYSLWPLTPEVPDGDGVRPRPATAPPEAIDRMDETLQWLCWLEPEERVLVVAEGGRHAVEVDHPPARDRPHHRLAALDDRPAQDRGPPERNG